MENSVEDILSRVKQIFRFEIYPRDVKKFTLHTESISILLVGRPVEGNPAPAGRRSRIYNI